MKVVLTPDALADLQNIAAWIAIDNPLRAVSFVNELRDAALGLAGLQRGYPLVPRYEMHGIRRRAYRRYGILYRAEAERILIFRFLDPGQDNDRALRLI